MREEKKIYKLKNGLIFRKTGLTGLNWFFFRTNILDTWMNVKQGAVHKLRWQDFNFFLTTYPPCVDIFYGMNVDSNGHFWTTYLPRLVNVVCERPLVQFAPQAFCNSVCIHYQILSKLLIKYVQFVHTYFSQSRIMMIHLKIAVYLGLTNALSFYRSQNVLGRSKLFGPDQKLNCI